MRKNLLVLLLLFCIYHANSQSRVVTGKITNESGVGIQGATVKETNKNGTMTDAEGKFSLQLVNGTTKVVEISYTGYIVQRVNIQNLTEIIITLKEDKAKSDLEEVIVIGAQRQSRRNTIASLSTLSGDRVENLPAPSIDVLLQGRVSGINVQLSSGEPGASPTLVVRGNSRVSKGIGDQAIAEAGALSGPLYVIDGMPMNADDLSGSAGENNTNFLAGINVNDIESVDVQKDAAATAAWGSRGANGVIYIKTRKGVSPTPEFRLNFYEGIVQRPELLKTFTGAEERRQKLELINSYKPTTGVISLPQMLTDSLNPYFNNATDWQGLFYKNGYITNADLTISANTPVVNYRVSFNYYGENGTIRSTGLRRYAFRSNFGFNINPKINSNLVISLSRTETRKGKKYGRKDTNIPFDADSQPTSFYKVNRIDSLSFLGLYDKLRNENFMDNASINFTTNYAISRNLRYTLQASANVTQYAKDYFRPSNIDQVQSVTDPSIVQPSYAESFKSSFGSYFVANSLDFNKKFATGDYVHNVSLTVSQQFLNEVAKSNAATGYNVPSNDIQTVTGIPQIDRGVSSGYGQSALLSVVGQLQYDLNNKYLLYASYRGDESSRFGKNSKWGYFPAFGLGWIVSDEKFMQGTKGIINFLKLRASWGISGNQSSNFYAPYNSYEITNYKIDDEVFYISYAGESAIQPSYTNGLAKNNLTWSKAQQKNLGLETQLFNSKLSVVAELYEKVSNSDFFDFDLPFFVGFSSINFNAKDLWVSNRGLDLTIGTRNITNGNKLKWNSNLVLSFNKNAIAKLPNKNRILVINDYNGVSRLYAVGQPIYTFFQMQYTGVYNKAADIPFNPLTGSPITYFKGYYPVKPGFPIWTDVNGDYDVWVGEDNGDQFADRIPSGDPNPKFTGGFNNDFFYKNFTLSISAIFTWKRTITNNFFQKQFDNFGLSTDRLTRNRLPDISNLNYWTPQKAEKEGSYEADFPSLSPFSDYYYQFFPFSTIWNLDGSYLKVKYVSLGYQLPSNFINKIKVKNARCYINLDNVLIIKSKSNTLPDPELVDQIGSYTGGLYPQPKKYTIGLTLQF